MSFDGKYKLVSSDNFDKFLKTAGVNFALRTLAKTSTPTQEIKQDGDEISIKTMTSLKTTEIKFKLGVEFDEEALDGRMFKTTVTQDGNKLIQSQKSVAKNDAEKLDTVLTRVFNGDEMTMILTVKDVTSTRVYKKIE